MSQNVITETITYSPAVVRAWANRPGSSHTVGVKGRVPAEVVSLWEAAGSPVLPVRRNVRDDSEDTVALVQVRRFRGAVLRRAVVEVPVSRAALRAVSRGAGRPQTSAYYRAALLAGTVTERDLVRGITTTAGGRYVVETSEDEDGETVQVFRCVSKSDSAAAVAAHLAVVLTD
jgi:hypothetical protein